MREQWPVGILAHDSPLVVSSFFYCDKYLRVKNVTLLKKIFKPLLLNWSAWNVAYTLSGVQIKASARVKPRDATTLIIFVINVNVAHIFYAM